MDDYSLTFPGENFYRKISECIAHLALQKKFYFFLNKKNRFHSITLKFYENFRFSELISLLYFYHFQKNLNLF